VGVDEENQPVEEGISLNGLGGAGKGLVQEVTGASWEEEKKRKETSCWLLLLSLLVVGVLLRFDSKRKQENGKVEYNGGIGKVRNGDRDEVGEMS